MEPKDERNKKDINLIWKHTPKGFRGSVAKDRMIMYFNNGTKLGPIVTMPTDLYENCLRLAKIKELKLKTKLI